jgi:phospholipid transport system substrate-binding protein
MKLFYLLLTTLFLTCTSASAQEDAPEALIKKVTDEVIAVLKQDKDIQSGDVRKAAELIETKVLPQFNFTRMTALAVGKDWNRASAEQKKQLSDEFRTLLVRTYSNALTNYKDQTLRYKPSKMQGDAEAVVRTEVLQPGGKPIAMDYSVEKLADGWKIYDVVVAGVSLVTNYRDTFAQEVRANGIDGLIQMLAAKNKQINVGKK